MSSKTRKFKVNYSKQTDKWEAGFLIQSFHDGKAWVWLKNCDKVTIRKGSVNEHFVAKLDSGESLTCAGYKIRILCENAITQASSPVAVQNIPSNQVEVPMANSTIKTPANDDSLLLSSQSHTPFLDPVLLRSMRSYQIEAASFLLNRLVDGPRNTQIRRNSDSPPPSRMLAYDLPLTGAILADDMGTGKTLVGLAVIWALCRHAQGKNWRKEINKWLPKTARTTIYISGQGGGKTNDLNVHAFVTSHASVHPLLVISYDMFRLKSLIYAEAFNTVLTLRTLLCDEGHRLKNSVGTKTSLALGNCIAMQRLVLTGTPIQNNLDELYAVVNFTVPGYLGTLDEFQRKFAKVISAGNDPQAPLEAVSKAEVARDALSKQLQTILIRRTGDTLLKELLPTRREYIVALAMQGLQQEKYLEVAHSLLRESNIGTITRDSDDLDNAASNGSLKKRKHRSSVVVEDEDDIIDEEEDESAECVSAPRRGCRRHSAAAPVTFTKKTEYQSVGAVPSMVLPGLQQLRVLCSSGAAVGKEEAEGAGGSTKRGKAEDKGGRPAKGSETIAAIMSNSSKLHILYSILLFMKSKQLRHEKIVIASNFISTLNTIEPIIRAAGHQFLRIDGSVASEKRQNIVDLFNDQNSPFSVCLISVKAGGVGLNLIGANRLVLFEPDYNPATDQQAIGRVWRVGQRKEVFIYRLVCAATIEESIIGRQQHKNLLSSVITERKNRKEMEQQQQLQNTTENSSASRGDRGTTGSSISIDFSSHAFDFSCQTPGLLQELILPSGSHGLGMHPRAEMQSSCQIDTDNIGAKANNNSSTCCGRESPVTSSLHVAERHDALMEKAVRRGYDDIILNKLTSDTLITCQIKVKTM